MIMLGKLHQVALALLTASPASGFWIPRVSIDNAFEKSSPSDAAITTVNSIPTTTAVETTSSTGFSFVTFTFSNHSGVTGPSTGSPTGPTTTSSTSSGSHTTVSTSSTLSSFTTTVNTSLPGVIIGHSTVPVQSPITISPSSGSTAIVIGPTSGHIGTDTFSIPSSPTTMTTDGTTIQFPGEVSTQLPTTETTSSGPSMPTLSREDKLLSAMDVSIDGSSSYSIPLPGQDTVEIQLPDGRTVRLSGVMIVVGSKPSEDQSARKRDNAPLLNSVSFPVPLHTDNSKTLSRGSGDNRVSVTFNPPPPPPSNPFSSVANALSGLGNAASDVVDGVGSIASGGESLLQSGGSAALDDLTGAIETTLGGIDDIQSTITGLQQSLADDLLAMADPDLKELIDTINTVRDVYDWIQSTKDTIDQFTGAVDVVKDKVRSLWPSDGYFDRHRKQLRDFAAYDWKNVKPGPELLDLYLIQTKRGTAWDDYQKFIEDLDKGKGYTQATETSRDQLYWTRIPASQARQARKSDIIRWVIRSPETEYEPQNYDLPGTGQDWLREAYESLSTRDRHGNWATSKGLAQSGLQPRARMDPRKDSQQNLKMISSNRIEKTAPQDDYVADDTLGKDQLIYIIDDGFDLNHPEFDQTHRTVTDSLVPANILELDLGTNLKHLFDEHDRTDHTGHGTAVAAIAGGIHHGVASKANLHLIKKSQKLRRQKRNPPSNPNEGSTEMLDAYSSSRTIIWAIEEVRKHWDSLGDKKPANGAVVNMSFGLYVPSPGPGQSNQNADDLIDILLDKFMDAKNEGIAFVFAAGNRDTSNPAEKGTLEEYFPSLMATELSEYIMVGGVNEDGTLWPHTRYETTNEERGPKDPTITLWAQASNIKLALTKELQQQFPQGRSVSGTSLAAPAVAGLVAYYRGLEQYGSTIKEPADLKKFLIDKSFQRVPKGEDLIRDTDKNELVENKARPDKLNVAYNWINGPPVECNSDGQAKRDVDGISFCHFAGNGTTIPTPTHTSHGPSSTSRTSTASATPTHVDLGDLTCGTRTDQGNPKYFMALDIQNGPAAAGANDGARSFCTWMKDTGAILSPDTPSLNFPQTFHYNQFHTDPIMFSARWTQDPGCPTLDFVNDGDQAFQTCMDRMYPILNYCDTAANGHFYWKQGGTFFRDCITWGIKRDEWIDGVPDESYRPPPTCDQESQCYDYCTDGPPNPATSCEDLYGIQPPFCHCSTL